MSGACVSPGPESLDALAWIARVGATPFDALQLVLGCSRRRALDHVRRLEEAGLVRHEAMRRGAGTLVLRTRAGALEAGCPPRRATRPVPPYAWAHASGCAWVSAWLALRGREWVSEREVLSPRSNGTPDNRPYVNVPGGRALKVRRRAPVRVQARVTAPHRTRLRCRAASWTLPSPHSRGVSAQGALSSEGRVPGAEGTTKAADPAAR